MRKKHFKNIRKFTILGGSVVAISTFIITLTSCGALDYGTQIYLAQDQRASIYFNQGKNQIIYVYDLGDTKDVAQAKIDYNAASTDLISREANEALSKVNSKNNVQVQYLLFKSRGREAYGILPVGYDKEMKDKTQSSILTNCGWGTNDIKQILGVSF